MKRKKSMCRNASRVVKQILENRVCPARGADKNRKPTSLSGGAILEDNNVCEALIIVRAV